MAGVSDYEKLRQQNIADNKRILAELGLLNPFEPLPRVIKKAPKRKRQLDVPKPEKRYIITSKDEPEPENLEGYGSQMEGSRRRSTRLTGQAPLSKSEIEEEAKKWREEEFDGEDEDGTPRRKSALKRPMAYGAIPGVDVGTVWPMRIDCNAAGIHRPTVAGIHGGPMGAYSIVLSGGYEDNIDLGTCFTYTGEGGRDLKGTVNKPKNLRTAPQSKDQCQSKGNAGLVKSVETGFPVRVVRGFKLTSPFAPEEGYRYDGLYKVEKWWYTVGVAGYGVFKFALKRLEDQAPPPWSLEGDEALNTEQGTQDSGVGSEHGSESGSECDKEDASSKKDTSENADSIEQNEALKVSGEMQSETDVKVESDSSRSDTKEDHVKKVDNEKEGEHKAKAAEDTDIKAKCDESQSHSEEVKKKKDDNETSENPENEVGSGAMAREETVGVSEEDSKSDAKTGVSGQQQEVDSVDLKAENSEDVECDKKDHSEKESTTKKSGKVAEGDDKENAEASMTPGGSSQKKKNSRRLSGKGSKQAAEVPAQKNTLLTYFNKA